MINKVVMPKMSLTMQSGQVVEWLKAVGDKVNKGETLCIIEGDKATIDIEAPTEGYLIKIFAEEGKPFPVKEVLAIIGDSPDTEVVESNTTASIETSSIEKPEVVKQIPALDKKFAEKKRINASPAAKRIAQENKVDLSLVEGSGPDGLIRKEDILVYLSTQESSQDIALPAFTRKILTQVERIIAERMSISNQEIPHFHLSIDVNIAQADALRRDFNDKAPIDAHLTITDLIVWVVSRTLKEHKRLNAAYQDNAILVYDQINIGLATDTPNGLMVVVIKEADLMSITALSTARKQLVERAQTGNQAPEDLQGGTFTITNLGMFGIKTFDPIIVPGQSGILGIGLVQPSGVEKEIINVTLACDHRIVDGVDGAKFLQTFAGYFKNPEQIFK